MAENKSTARTDDKIKEIPLDAAEMTKNQSENFTNIQFTTKPVIVGLFFRILTSLFHLKFILHYFSSFEGLKRNKLPIPS